MTIPHTFFYPSPWTVSRYPFLEFDRYDHVLNADMYTLNSEHLSANECHMFFRMDKVRMLMLALAIDQAVRHRLSTSHQETFSLSAIQLGGLKIRWCRFPKRFQGECERLATEIFHMKKNAFSKQIICAIEREDSIPKKTENLVLDCVGFPTLFLSCTRAVFSNTVPRAGQKNRGASLSNSQVFNFLGYRLSILQIPRTENVLTYADG